jgi:hypothetical protein
MEYTYSLRLGKERALDIECEIDGAIINDGGEPTLDVHELCIEGSAVNLLKLEPHTDGYRMGQMILDSILNDTAFIEDAAVRDGWRYVTRGGTDPDARWVQP